MTIPAAPTGPSGAWAQVFADDFLGTTFDASVWYANGYTNNSMSSGSSAANVQVANSIVTLFTPGAGQGGQLVSQTTWMAVGDCVEFYANFNGYNWPAVWTSGPNWPSNGEIDVMEWLGKATCNYHYGAAGTNGSQDGPFAIPGTWTGWHRFTAVRHATSVDVYWDGTLVQTMATNDAGGAQNVLLTCGPGNTVEYGAAYGLEVDYVVVWTPSTSSTSTTSTSSTSGVQAIQKVQEAEVNSASGNPQAITLPAVSSSNKLFLAVLNAPSTVTVSGVTGGGTWAKIGSIASSGLGANMELWRCTGLTGGNTTAQVAFSAPPSSNSVALWMAEFSGVSSTQEGATETQYGTTLTPTTLAVTPTQSGDLALAFAAPQSYPVTASPGNPWTAEAGPGNWGNSSGSMPLAWQVVTGTTSQTAQWTMPSGNNWTTLAALFKAKAANAGSATAGDSVAFSSSAGGIDTHRSSAADMRSWTASAVGSETSGRTAADSVTFSSSATAFVAGRSASDTRSWSSSATGQGSAPAPAYAGITGLGAPGLSVDYEHQVVRG